MSKVNVARCDLGGEFRELHDVIEVNVDGTELDVCEEHAQSHTVRQLLDSAATTRKAAEARAEAQDYGA